MVGHRNSSKNNNAESAQDYLDLTVVDQAFGDFADLYSDVLRVSVAATPEQIQLAYFDRRSELFTLLAKIDAKQPQTKQTATDRFHTERKMDSVVLAVRILGDPTQRLRYDRMRQERLLNRRRAMQGQLPGFEPESPINTSLDAPSVVDEHDYTPNSHHRGNGNSHSKRKSSSKKKDRKNRRQMEIEVMEQTSLSPEEPQHQGRASPKRSSKDKKGSSSSSRKRNYTMEEPTDKYQPAVVTPTHHDEDQVRMRNTTSSDETEGTDPTVTDGEDDSATADREPRTRGRSRRRSGSEDQRDGEEEDDDNNTAKQNERGGCLALFKGSSKSNNKSSSSSSVQKSSGALSCLGSSRTFRKLSDEISGAFEDTLVSVDQVFNAFTLTDKDIKAVTKRIDRAKHQLH